MKKYVFSLLLVASAGGGELYAQGLGVGVRAGATFSSLTGPDTKRPVVEAIWGPTAGVFVNVPLTPDSFFSFQPELQYSRKGFRTVYSPTYAERIFLHTLELPLLAKLKVAGFVAEAGPQVGYLLAVKGKGVGGDPSAPEGVNGYHRWAAGYVAGVGYELTSGLGVSLRYNGAFTNVRQLPENVPPLPRVTPLFSYK